MWTQDDGTEVTSSFQGFTTPIRDLYSAIASRGWEVKKVKWGSEGFEAEAQHPGTGQKLKAVGPTEDAAVAHLLLSLTRSDYIRTRTAGMWETTFVDKLAQLAEAYSKAPVYEPKAVGAWMELAQDSQRRYETLQGEMQIEVVDEPEPYPSLEEMAEDVHKHKHLFVSRAAAEHPLWSTDQVVAFRAVHDVLGHAAARADWGWHGENQACAHHFPLLAPNAQQALFSECIARAAYAQVYKGYGPHKIALLSDEFEEAQAAENGLGHQGVHPSQSIPTTEVPRVSGRKEARPADPDWWDSYAGPDWQDFFHGTTLDRLPEIRSQGLVPWDQIPDQSHRYQNNPLFTPRPGHVYLTEHEDNAWERHLPDGAVRVVLRVNPKYLDAQKVNPDEDAWWDSLGDSAEGLEQYPEGAADLEKWDELPTPKHHSPLGPQAERIGLGDDPEHTRIGIENYNSLAYRGTIPPEALEVKRNRGETWQPLLLRGPVTSAFQRNAGYIDPNDGWQSGVEPTVGINGQPWRSIENDPLGIHRPGPGGVSALDQASNLARVDPAEPDKRWWDLQHPDGSPNRDLMRKAVVNGFGAVLLSPQKDSHWHAVHYQDVADLAHTTEDPTDLHKRLEQRRVEHNATKRISPLAHRPYYREQQDFAQFLKAANPGMNDAEAQRAASVEVHRIVETEKKRLADELEVIESGKPMDKRTTLSVIEAKAAHEVPRILKAITNPAHDPHTDFSSRGQVTAGMDDPEPDPEFDAERRDMERKDVLKGVDGTQEQMGEIMRSRGMNDPDWTPLEWAIPPSHRDGWMWMGYGKHGVREYKHNDTRRYMFLLRREEALRHPEAAKHMPENRPNLDPSVAPLIDSYLGPHVPYVALVPHGYKNPHSAVPTHLIPRPIDDAVDYAYEDIDKLGGTHPFRDPPDTPRPRQATAENGAIEEFDGSIPPEAMGAYGAWMHDHLKSIAQVSRHSDHILDAALKDIKDHDGAGHHFRAYVLSLGLRGVGPQVASHAWFMLAPELSQLGVIDGQMLEALGRKPDEHPSPRDYFRLERELRARMDATGYHDVPLGVLGTALWDYKVHGRDSHQDHTPLRPLNHVQHGNVDWVARAPQGKSGKLTDPWWKESEGIGDQIGDHFDQTVGSKFRADEVPFQDDRRYLPVTAATATADELHVAWAVPPAVRKQIADWAYSAEWPDGAELEEPEEYHITAVYAHGGWNDKATHALLRQYVTTDLPFQATGLDLFGPDKDTVVIRLASEEAERWASLLMDRAEELGLDVSRFPGGYKAHITVGTASGLPKDDLPDLSFRGGKLYASRPREIVKADPDEHHIFSALSDPSPAVTFPDGDEDVGAPGETIMRYLRGQHGMSTEQAWEFGGAVGKVGP